MQQINSLPHCPSCASSRTVLVGKMPATRQFGGETLGAKGFKSELYKCRGCYLLFRWPRLAPEHVDDLYRKSVAPYSDISRKDWQIAVTWLNGKSNGGTILDIGCYDGAFLVLLGEMWECQGVEINEGASQEAHRKGIHIIASHVDKLRHADEFKNKYDVVTAMDVIEHMPDPLLFLKTALSVVKPGGSVLISSGNTSSLSWKIMGSYYWYGLFLDHISFINNDWCRHAAKELSVVLKKTINFSHGEKCSVMDITTDVLKNVSYRIAPGMFSMMRRGGLGGINAKDYPCLADSPPYWKTAKDHIMAIFEKPYQQ